MYNKAGVNFEGKIYVPATQGQAKSTADRYMPTWVIYAKAVQRFLLFLSHSDIDQSVSALGASVPV